jgi:hypothetical protein
MADHDPTKNEDAYEGSDDDYAYVMTPMHEIEKEVEVKPEEILTYIMEKNLEFSKPDSQEIKTFYSTYKKTFAKQQANRFVAESGNLLHVLAIQSSPAGKFREYWTKDKLFDFLGCFLDQHYLFLEETTGERKDFPLHTAILNKNDSFTRAVLELKNLKNLKSVLVQTREGDNYIQVAVQASSSLMATVATRCTELTLPVWEGVDKIGKESVTPLHTAVQKVYRLLPKERLEDRLLAKPGHKMHSQAAEIYAKWKEQYVIKERKTHNQDVGDTKVGAGANQPVEASAVNEDADANGAKDDVNTTNQDDKDAGPDFVSRKDMTRLMFELISFYEKSQQPLSQVDTIKLFIKLCENALMSQSRIVDRKTMTTVRETPYQKRLAKLRTAWTQLVKALEKDNIWIKEDGITEEAAIRVVAIEDPVADTIRYHCLSRLNRDQIAKCLYQPGDGESWTT